MAVLLNSTGTGRLITALFLLALLLYLVPATFRLRENERWLRRGAVLTLATALAIAVAASLLWLTQ